MFEKIRSEVGTGGALKNSSGSRRVYEAPFAERLDGVETAASTPDDVPEAIGNDNYGPLGTS